MLSIIGATLILCAIADVLQTLFRLLGAGLGSDLAARGAWRTLKTVSRGPILLQFGGDADADLPDVLRRYAQDHGAAQVTHVTHATHV
jgi:hypothetical protein